MKLLITGCRGFLGGSVGREAARAGHELVGLGRASQPPEGWPGGYRMLDVATADLAPVLEAERPQAVLHAAGSASVGASLAAPLDDLRASVLCWANLLDGVRRWGGRALSIFPSSAAVYGQPERLPVGEQALVRPISPYGYHKAACELLAREHASCFGQSVLVCRFFSLFGAAQRRLLVWELFNQFSGSAQQVWLEGSGEETRDYLSLPDASAALLGLAEGWLAEGLQPEVRTLNVASGEQTTVRALADQVGRLLGASKPVGCRGRARPGDPPHWQADTSALRARLPAWRPRPLEQTLAECLACW